MWRARQGRAGAVSACPPSVSSQRSCGVEDAVTIACDQNLKIITVSFLQLHVDLVCVLCNHTIVKV